LSFSVAGTIRKQAAERDGATALTFQDRAITFAELDERSSRVAQGLRDAGVGPQDRIAFLDKNCPEYFDTLFGGAKLNAVDVAVNWRLAPPEISYIVNDAQAKVLFIGEEFAAVLDEISGDLQTVEKIVVLGKHPDHESYEDWIGRFAADDPGVPSAPDDVAFQLYTSGTTGLPKGAMLMNSNFATLMDNCLPEWGFRPDGVSLVVMPLFHIAGGGWAFAGIYSGCHSVMLREVDPNEILAAIPRHGVTNTIFVPAILQFLLMMPNVTETDYSTLEYILYGASPISEDVLRRSMEVFGCNFVQAYGLTETTGAITSLAAADHDPDNRPELLRSAGKPYPWIELRIVEPDTGSDAEPGAVGELWTRSAQNMKGYWNLPEATAEVITPDGWLRTGDAGYMKDGYVYLHDRVKDMIVSGGENVYPAEIENVLMSHPGIDDVAVIGIPDERWGETAKAIAVRAEGSDVSQQELIDYARERLAHYKCPTSVDFVDGPLPRNPSGKLLKRVLREPYWEGRERRIH
jgi:long-chain acyl-CoA synthetase